jgi:hypothetical protein
MGTKDPHTKKFLERMRHSDSSPCIDIDDDMLNSGARRKCGAARGIPVEL